MLSILKWMFEVDWNYQEGSKAFEGLGVGDHRAGEGPGAPSSQWSHRPGLNTSIAFTESIRMPSRDSKRFKRPWPSAQFSMYDCRLRRRGILCDVSSSITQGLRGASLLLAFVVASQETERSTDIQRHIPILHFPQTNIDEPHKDSKTHNVEASVG